MTIKELSKYLGVSEGALRSFLGNYQFSKYIDYRYDKCRSKTHMFINVVKDFWKIFDKLLEIKIDKRPCSVKAFAFAKTISSAKIKQPKNIEDEFKSPDISVDELYSHFDM